MGIVLQDVSTRASYYIVSNVFKVRSLQLINRLRNFNSQQLGLFWSDPSSRFPETNGAAHPAWNAQSSETQSFMRPLSEMTDVPTSTLSRQCQDPGAGSGEYDPTVFENRIHSTIAPTSCSHLL
jgi:hypothetical protein